MSFIRTGISLAAAVLVIVAPLITLAAPDATTTNASDVIYAENVFGRTSDDVGKPDGLSMCFGHYTYGSTPVVLESDLAEVSAGSTLTFSGEVQNQNPYNIPNAAIWIKVVRSRNAPDANGPDVIDFFKLADNLNIPAKGSLPVQGSWKVPAGAVNGSYQVLTFVTESDRFNLSGLTFSDDVVGNPLNFKVVGGGDTTVGFAKDGTTVLNRPYLFASFPPTVSKTIQTPVISRIDNPTADGYKGTVNWQLYYWDAIGPGHLLDEKKEDIKIQPQASTTVEYDVTDTAHSVYYLVGTLTSDTGTKSIIGVRFVRGGINTPRLNFVGYDPAGSSPVAFACIHSTGNTAAQDTQVKLAVYRTGLLGAFLNLFGPLAHAQYSGRVTSDIYALTVPVHASGPLTIRADVAQNGKEIDSISEPYCSTASCASLSLVDWLITGVTLLIAIALVAILVRMRKNRRAQRTMPTQIPPAPPTPPYVP